MIKKFKTWLIHRLGGMTGQESIESDHNSYDLGVYTTVIAARTFAHRLYGKPAEEWCKAMYGFLDEQLKTFEDKHGIPPKTE